MVTEHQDINLVFDTIERRESTGGRCSERSTACPQRRSSALVGVVDRPGGQLRSATDLPFAYHYRGTPRGRLRRPNRCGSTRATRTTFYDLEPWRHRRFRPTVAVLVTRAHAEPPSAGRGRLPGPPRTGDSPTARFRPARLRRRRCSRDVRSAVASSARLPTVTRPLHSAATRRERG